MDYKEKYEKALEWMKSIYPTMQGSDKEDAEHYFPELAESEDEKIRKVLIHIVKSACSKYGIKYIGDKITEEMLLAYIEEQKPVENGGKELLYVSNKSYNIGYRDGKREAESKQEWSENDTAFLNEITDFFENKTVRLQHDLDMYAHWLKNLPERFNLQPIQEWSEADEVYLQDALWCVEKAEKSCKDEEDKGACWSAKRWLKSLRPSWKPSEEQMKALERAANKFAKTDFDDSVRLSVMYKNLKKLM